MCPGSGSTHVETQQYHDEDRRVTYFLSQFLLRQPRPESEHVLHTTHWETWRTTEQKTFILALHVGSSVCPILVFPLPLSANWAKAHNTRTQSRGPLKVCFSTIPLHATLFTLLLYVGGHVCNLSCQL